MTDYAYQDMVATAPPWHTCHWYHVGDRVLWQGHLLCCDIDHYAGHQAADPWDPGWGWDVRKRTAMWRVLVPA